MNLANDLTLTILQRVEREGGDKESFHQTVIAPYKAALECWYIDHRSVGLYFRLIFLTAEAVLHPSSRKWWDAFKDQGIPEVPERLKGYV